MASKSRAVSAKGVEEFKPYITRALPIAANLVCADNTGAKILRIAQVTRIKGRHSRMPSASVGDFVNVTVKKGRGIRPLIAGRLINVDKPMPETLEDKIFALRWFLAGIFLLKEL